MAVPQIPTFSGIGITIPWPVIWPPFLMPSNSPTGIPSNSSVIFVSVSVNVSLKIAPELTLMEGKSVNLRLKLPERFTQVRKSKTLLKFWNSWRFFGIPFIPRDFLDFPRFLLGSRRPWIFHNPIILFIRWRNPIFNFESLIPFRSAVVSTFAYQAKSHGFDPL